MAGGTPSDRGDVTGGELGTESKGHDLLEESLAV